MFEDSLEDEKRNSSCFSWCRNLFRKKRQYSTYEEARKRHLAIASDDVKEFHKHKNCSVNVYDITLCIKHGSVQCLHSVLKYISEYIKSHIDEAFSGGAISNICFKTLTDDQMKCLEMLTLSRLPKNLKKQHYMKIVHLDIICNAFGAGLIDVCLMFKDSFEPYMYTEFSKRFGHESEYFLRSQRIPYTLTYVRERVYNRKVDSLHKMLTHIRECGLDTESFFPERFSSKKLSLFEDLVHISFTKLSFEQNATYMIPIFLPEVANQLGISCSLLANIEVFRIAFKECSVQLCMYLYENASAAFREELLEENILLKAKYNMCVVKEFMRRNMLVSENIREYMKDHLVKIFREYKENIPLRRFRNYIQRKHMLDNMSSEELSSEEMSSEELSSEEMSSEEMSSEELSSEEMSSEELSSEELSSEEMSSEEMSNEEMSNEEMSSIIEEHSSSHIIPNDVEISFSYDVHITRESRYERVLYESSLKRLKSLEYIEDACKYLDMEADDGFWREVLQESAGEVEEFFEYQDLLAAHKLRQIQTMNIMCKEVCNYVLGDYL
jgi:hypothetical protein